MTDVIVAAEAVEEVQPVGLDLAVLDDQLIGHLLDRAKVDGVRLTGLGIPGGQGLHPAVITHAVKIGSINDQRASDNCWDRAGLGDCGVV
ncbi:hypothetical protein [Streptomyces lydicus]|uniref:hypothetical protein n=1 Tax=Streptomyces lydicus TaxID=47763 RepID=UPI0036E5E704